MNSKKFPWFRLYTETVDDEKLRLLAFEDRWHFIALLCLKGQGLLDEGGPLLMRKVAVKLGLDTRALEEVARRLSEVGLIDQNTLQPLAWDKRQMKSDSSAERVKAFRERKKQANKSNEKAPKTGGNGYCNVTVTAQDTDTDTDIKQKQKKIKEKKADVVFKIPDKLNTPEFLQAWEEWQTYRKQRRQTLTAFSIKKQLEFLSSIGAKDAVISINESIKNGYTGLFPVKQAARNKNNSGFDAMEWLKNA